MLPIHQTPKLSKGPDFDPKNSFNNISPLSCEPSDPPGGPGAPLGPLRTLPEVSTHLGSREPGTPLTRRSRSFSLAASWLASGGRLIFAFQHFFASKDTRRRGPTNTKANYEWHKLTFQ